MTAARIQADARGRLLVPDEPILAIVPGDGASSGRIWKTIQPLVEGAVRGAYQGRRRAHFIEVVAGDRAQREVRTRAPDSAVNTLRTHRVGLVGPLRDVRGEGRLWSELADVLDLFVHATHVTGQVGAEKVDAWIVREEREEAGAQADLERGMWSRLAVGYLQAEQPQRLASMRFGTASEADAFRLKSGDVPVGEVEAAFALAHASRIGTARIVRAAMELANTKGRGNVEFAGAFDDAPLLQSTLESWALETASGSESGAARKPAFKSTPAATLLDRAAGQATSIDVVVASHRIATQLVDLLVARRGGASGLVTMHANRDTGHAFFAGLDESIVDDVNEQASPVAFLRASVALLAYIGWSEAAAALGAAVEGALGDGSAAWDTYVEDVKRRLPA